jgi:hypothetical protein
MQRQSVGKMLHDHLGIIVHLLIWLRVSVRESLGKRVAARCVRPIPQFDPHY